MEVEPGNVLPEPHEAGVDVDGGLPPASTRGVALGPELRAAPTEGQASAGRLSTKTTSPSGVRPVMLGLRSPVILMEKILSN